MRVLTKREQQAFEQAFDFLDRIGMLYNHPQVQNVHDIQVEGVGLLPPRVVTFISEIGGLKELNKHFNPTAKERTLPRFINRLMSRKEQPRDYWAGGVLIVRKQEVIEYAA
jgi:hypothetical protein